MPLYWTIDSRSQFFAITCDGNVGIDDANAMIDAMLGTQVLSFRKLFDALHGTTNMNAEEMLTFGVRLRELHLAPGDHGALAVVFPEEKCIQLSRLLGILAAARRPMRVFHDPDKARKWLDSPAIRGTLPALESPGRPV